MYQRPFYHRQPTIIPIRSLTYEYKHCIRIPTFQRDYVWDFGRRADLLDSILKGFPIGTISVLRTSLPIKYKDSEFEVDNRFGLDFLIDGQQRLGTIVEWLIGNRSYISPDGELVETDELLGPEFVPLNCAGDIQLHSKWIRNVFEAGIPDSRLYEADRRLMVLKDYQIAVSPLVTDDPVEVRTAMLRLASGGMAFTPEDVERLYQELT